MAAGAALTASGFAASATAAADPVLPFNAVQMSPHSMLDEGIDHCLDLIQETAAVNCIMVYSHAYGGDMRKAAAHPRERPRHAGEGQYAKATCLVVWVKPREEVLPGYVLRHQKVDATFEYGNRDLFAELVEPCRKRGIKLYARILEGGGG